MNALLSQTVKKVRLLPVSRTRRIELICGLGITAALALLHVFLLFNRGPLWRDEISSLSLATQPTWGRFWGALGLDPCPPFFFLCLRAWSALVGQSDFALRILGCLIGLACLAAFWISARLTGRRTPLLSLLLLGMSPTLLLWGDSLRAYGIGVFWILLCFGFFWKLAERPSFIVVVAATVTSILSVQSVYINSLMVFSCAVAATAVVVRRRMWKRAFLILGVGAVTALSLLPYIPLFRQTNEWAGLLRVNFTFADSFFVLGLSLLGRRHLPFWIWLILLAIALVVVLLARSKSNDRGPSTTKQDLPTYGLFAALLAFASTIIGFRIVGWGTNVWYYLPMLTVVALGVDAILDFGVDSKVSHLARALVALVCLAVAAPLLLKASELRASNLDQVAQLVAKSVGPNDLVVVWPAADGITFQRYLRGPVDWMTIPPAPNLPAQPGDNVLAPFVQRGSIQPVLNRINATLRKGGRVWLASSWSLELPEGTVQPVQPLDKKAPQTIGHFLRGWGYELAGELAAHAQERAEVSLPEDQPISSYEHSCISVFSGWRDGPIAAKCRSLGH